MITLTSRVLEHLFTPYVNETQWRRTRGFAAAHQDSPTRVQPPGRPTFKKDLSRALRTKWHLLSWAVTPSCMRCRYLPQCKGGLGWRNLLDLNKWPAHAHIQCASWTWGWLVHASKILGLFLDCEAFKTVQNRSLHSTGPSKFEKHSLSSLPLATSLDGFVHFRSETNRSTSSGQVLYQSYECATRVSLDNGELLYFWLILTVLLKKWNFRHVMWLSTSTILRSFHPTKQKK